MHSFIDITGIDHIYLSVTDLKTAEAFYDRVLKDVLGHAVLGVLLPASNGGFVGPVGNRDAEFGACGIGAEEAGLLAREFHHAGGGGGVVVVAFGADRGEDHGVVGRRRGLGEGDHGKS